jgi:hypothetical protein
MSAAWAPYWWPILALSVGGIALTIINLLEGYWSRPRLLARIVLNTIGIGIAYLLFQQEELIVVGDAALEIGKLGNAATFLNKSAHGVLVVVALIMSAEIVSSVRKLLEPSNRERPRAAGGMTA